MSSLLFSPTCLNPIQGLVDFTQDSKPFRSKIFETGVFFSFDDIITASIVESQLSLIETNFNLHRGTCVFPTPSCIIQGFETQPFGEIFTVVQTGDYVQTGPGFEPTLEFQITVENTGYPIHGQSDIHGNQLYYYFPICEPELVDVVADTCKDDPTPPTAKLDIRVSRIFVETPGGPVLITVDLPPTLRNLDFFKFKSIQIPPALLGTAWDATSSTTYESLRTLLTPQIETYSNGVELETEFIAVLVNPTPHTQLGWFRSTFEIHSFAHAVDNEFQGSYADWVQNISYSRAASNIRNVGRVSFGDTVDVGLWSAVSAVTVDSVTDRILVHVARAPSKLKTGDELIIDSTISNLPLDLEWLINLARSAQLTVQQEWPNNDSDFKLPTFSLVRKDTGAYITSTDAPVGFNSAVFNSSLPYLSVCRKGFEMFIHELNLFESGLDNCNSLLSDICADLTYSTTTATRQVIDCLAVQPIARSSVCYIPMSPYRIAVSNGFNGTEAEWAQNPVLSSFTTQFNVLPGMPDQAEIGVIGIVGNSFNATVATVANIDLTLTGSIWVDQYQLQVSDTVLVKNQTDKRENGVYYFAQQTQRLVRHPDFLSDFQLRNSSVYVKSGIHQHTKWKAQPTDYPFLFDPSATDMGTPFEYIEINQNALDSVELVVHGVVENADWNWSAPGVTVYLTATGTFVEGDATTGNPPGNSDDFIVAGTTLSPTKLMFSANPTFCFQGFELFAYEVLEFDGGLDLLVSIKKQKILEPLFTNRGLEYIQPTTIAPRISQTLTIRDVTTQPFVLLNRNW